MRKIKTAIISFLLVQTTMAQTIVVHDRRTPKKVTDVQVKEDFEEMVVYRIKVKITVGVGRSAGTDDRVYIQLNANDEKFYLYKAGENFHTEGRTATYDVLCANVKKVKDIMFLRLGIKGDDGFCVKKIQLFFNSNSSPVYENEHGGSGRCVDNHSDALQPTYEVSKADLREHPNWAFTASHKGMDKAPAEIAKSWIVSAVECAIGNQLVYQGGIEWGNTGGINTIWGDAVEVERKNAHTLHFDLDLQRDIAGPNPEVDIDFDLDFRCENGIIQIETRNLTTGTNFVGDIQSFIREKGTMIVGYAIGIVTGTGMLPVVGTGLLAKALSFSIKLNPAAPNVSSSCSNINITTGMDIKLN